MTPDARTPIHRQRTIDELSAKLTEIRTHYDRYELAEAEALARSVTAAHPADAAALLLLGRVLIARYRPGEALPVLAETAALAPGDPAITGWRIALALIDEVDRGEDALPLGAALALDAVVPLDEGLRRTALLIGLGWAVLSLLLLFDPRLRTAQSLVSVIRDGAGLGPAGRPPETPPKDNTSKT
ncbi:hypothetical protein [Nonomuraea sp. NPDC046570]|uniref:hypothetical protein n=1 Tax=Nonomuraea sp. NPDC046570 TaxID=3155255 RepID=UPI0033EEDA48